MVELKLITDFIESIFPPSFAEDFDNIGLLIGRQKKEINKAIICLDCDKNVVKEAIEEGAELIITHHPVIFNPMKKITDDTDHGEMIVTALENGISIYSAHTNFDSAPGGLTDSVVKELELIPIGNMEGELGRLCRAPFGETAKTLTERIKERFGIANLYSTFTKNKPIETVAVCNGGGGGSLVETAKALKADVYISGDLKHHEHSMFKVDDSIDFIEMRHFDSEIIACDILYKKLDERFIGDVQFKISKVQSNPLIDTNLIK